MIFSASDDDLSDSEVEESVRMSLLFMVHYNYYGI